MNMSWARCHWFNSRVEPQIIIYHLCLYMCNSNWSILDIVSELQKKNLIIQQVAYNSTWYEGKSVDFVNLSITRIAPKCQYLSCTVLWCCCSDLLMIPVHIMCLNEVINEWEFEICTHGFKKSYSQIILYFRTNHQNITSIS